MAAAMRTLYLTNNHTDMHKNQRGFLLVEVIVAIAIAGVLFGVATMFMSKMIHVYQTSRTIARVDKLEVAFEHAYRTNAEWAERNCYGFAQWNQGTAAECVGLTLTPWGLGLDTQQNFFNIGVNAQTKDSIINEFEGAGCTATLSSTMASTEQYRVECDDAYGQDFMFTRTAGQEHNPGTPYSTLYMSNSSVRIRIQSTGNADIMDEWSAAPLDLEYSRATSAKNREVGDALKQYHLNRLVREVNDNPCDSTAGGLESRDDVIIPWIWQVNAVRFEEKCSGIDTTPCGCSNFDGQRWPTGGTLVMYTSALVDNALANIGLSPARYRTDAVGNAIAIVLLADRFNNPISPSGVPPRPRPNYYDCLKNGTPGNCGGFLLDSLPPYASAIGPVSQATFTSATWLGNTERVVYPQ